MIRTSALLWCVAASTMSCEETGPYSGAQSRDLGTISIDRSGGVAKHTFHVANHRQRHLEILDITRSCGCLDAVFDKRNLNFGDVAEVTLSLELEATGRVAEQAIVWFDDGSKERLTLTAQGIFEKELRTILLGPRLGDGTVPIHLLAFSRDSAPETKVPTVVAPDEVILRFVGWTTLEDPPAYTGRPIRQLGTAGLDFTEFSGDFPVKIVIETKSGRSSEVTVY